MNYILFDGNSRKDLLPLTFTRPIANLRIGILTIREKWEKRLNTQTSTITTDYLSGKFPKVASADNILLYGGLCPNQELIEAIFRLDKLQGLSRNGKLIAVRLDEVQLESFSVENLSSYQLSEYKGELVEVRKLWDIFSKNGTELERDFELITHHRESQAISETNTVIGSGSIFIEEGAKVEAAVLNTTNGSIYIGENAEVMEGAVVRGGLALCSNSTLKLGAKIYGPTTIGPHSKVGGEVNNSVILGYSNKGHDGFLGNSVLGEWVNIGADTNNSNLKNNYDEVKLWNYSIERFERTGLQFCGLIMGDHSKCGINTMFNTGTVVGVSSNVFGGGFPRNFVSSFAWGGAAGFSEYKFDKAMETAKKVMERRLIELSEHDTEILQKVFDLTKGYRKA